MAQPEIAELAKKMWEEYSNNIPNLLTPGQWHLPFVTKEEIENASHDLQTYGGYSHVTAWDVLIKRSVARCARVSYLNHDGTNSTHEQDCALHDRLLSEQPIHASPAEHQAEARSNLILGLLDPSKYSSKIYSGNLRGWIQYRKTLPNENITEFKESLG
jgi:thymidylate synthase ThyX